MADGELGCSDEAFNIERAYAIEEAATTLLTAVWRAIGRGSLPERGPIADAALVLRDALNPDWPRNPDWLPEPLASGSSLNLGLCDTDAMFTDEQRSDYAEDITALQAGRSGPIENDTY